MSRADSSSQDGPRGLAGFCGSRRASRSWLSRAWVSPSRTSSASSMKAQAKKPQAESDSSGPISLSRRRSHRRVAGARSVFMIS